MEASRVADAVRHQLQLLMTGYGYNLYEDKNRTRADDLLVRGQAAGALSEAANALRTLRTEYHRRFVPPLTREQPDPPRERLDALAEIARLGQRLSDIEVAIRSMPAPTQDKVWERFRREQTLLSELLLQDYNLIAPCYAVRDLALALTAGAWGVEPGAEVARLAAQIEAAVRSRAGFLSLHMQ
jgi:hypothetical protein